MAKYTYKMRPAYGGGNMLIEFDIYPDMDKFMEDLAVLLGGNGFSLGEVNDVWMNDEVWVELKSPQGSVMLTKDIWDMVFIMTINDQTPEVILAINDILEASNQFESTPYDIEEYL